MADIEIGSDGLLTEQISVNDRMVFTSAETGQQIAAMTVGEFVAQIEAMRPKLDYTSTGEQIIPGRKILCPDGIIRQAYIRTFYGTVPADGSRITLSQNVLCAHLEWGGILTTLGEFEPPGMITGESMSYYWIYGLGDGEIIIHDIGNRYWGGKYTLTFIYAKTNE